MPNDFDTELAERLMRYAAIDSQSDEDSASAPSTQIQ
ncbi:MAG: tripeptide aminopeptidase, partial [Polaromonas sp.]